MQIIGIYLRKGSKKVIKNLEENTWYPFGNFPNLHKIFYNGILQEDDKYTEVLKKIKDNKKFINQLYEIQNSEITVNLNCVLGKNGAGKSSLLNLEYRIINNLSCRINFCLPSHNQDYHPSWATGFDAELYYELSGKLYCITIYNNFDFLEINTEYFKNRIKISFLGDKKLNDCFYDIESYLANKTEEEIDEYLINKQDELIDELSEHLFYSVATNYSIYSNASVKNCWNLFTEKWQNNLYHKNDGYFTPIVLVPYKQSGATIDTEKELQLAEERVSTLSILIYAEKKHRKESKYDFIDGLIPESIEYRLKNVEEYSKEIKIKYLKVFNDGIYDEEKIESDYKKISKKNHLESIQKSIRKKLESLLFTQQMRLDYLNKLKIENISQKKYVLYTIAENTIQYITYKLIKMCIYYDAYKKMFPTTNPLVQYGNYTNEYLGIYNQILENIINNPNDTDFSNLKILQCVTFLRNLSIFFTENIQGIDVKCTHIYTIQIEKIINNLQDKKYSYDLIFKNLLPAYFIKEVKFKRQNDNMPNYTNVSLSSLSSGQSQMLNSLSYAIYHMKNASCKQSYGKRIQYKNMNLIFDEAELYYHPEYQRGFILNLLMLLEKSNLELIESINITIVTHSPFMLSDIPNSNILLLPQDKQADIISKTLGANIYDLIKNQFFMEASIGAVVEKHLLSILNTFYDTDISKELIDNYNQNKDFFDLFYKNLGDSYLKSLLSDIIQKMDTKSKPINEQIAEYKEKIKQLEIIQELEESEKD